MKTTRNTPIVTQEGLNRVAAGVGVLLLVPLVGNQVVEGWNWGVFDFVIIGTMLFISGLAIDFIIRKFKNPVHRLAASMVVILIFLALWIEMAVGGVSLFMDLGL